MTQPQRWLWAVVLIAGASSVQAQGFGGMLDRLGAHVAQTVEDRAAGTTDKAVNGAFNKTDDTVDCVAGDPNCAPSANQVKAGAADAPAALPATAKCLATDTACLKEAKANGQTVQIVTEDEVDTFHCASSDTKCLQRAQKLGKKVAITD